VADPAHNTLAHTAAAAAAAQQHASSSRFPPPLLRAPPLKSAEERPPAGDPNGDPRGGGSKGGRSASCRQRCIWGDAVCRALLGESWGAGRAESCDDEDGQDELAPELRGDGEEEERVPVPIIARKRVFA
jgi:hypothetical protein